MISTPHWWWPTALLALALLGDALISIRPPAFIRNCLVGVRFPQDWWWTLVVIKATAAAGLIVGLTLPGVGFAANAGVVVYFGCAAVAHYRARFFGPAFWLNCLGMLGLAIGVLGVSYLP